MYIFQIFVTLVHSCGFYSITLWKYLPLKMHSTSTLPTFKTLIEDATS